MLDPDFWILDSYFFNSSGIHESETSIITVS